MTTPPDMPNIGDLNLPTLLRRVKIALPLGLAVFVLGAVVIATGPLALGVALLVLGILCPVVAIALLLVASRRTKEFTRDMQARQQAAQGDLERAVRDYQQRHQGEY
jgi:ABC-type transport system involved in cytochrome bd biosynthesis fused ATPase/permease subunit